MTEKVISEISKIENTLFLFSTFLYIFIVDRENPQ